jgi:hypothetical protein
VRRSDSSIQFSSRLAWPRHVVKAEDALDHKHNSLVAGVAQSALTNSLKVDENSFKRNERKNYYAEIKAAMEEYKAKLAQQKQQE